MSETGFGLFCLLGFLIPVPLLAWLDRPRRSAPRESPPDSA
jgi:hypothetical protein